MEKVNDVMRELGDFQLKEEQKAIIDSIIKTQDTIAVLPTGYGKSLCYIVSPLILDKEDSSKKHTSLAISPLKALMKDQMSSLRGRNIPSYGLLEGAEKEDLAGIKDGLASIFFASPLLLLPGTGKTPVPECGISRNCGAMYMQMDVENFVIIK